MQVNNSLFLRQMVVIELNQRFCPHLDVQNLINPDSTSKGFFSYSAKILLRLLLYSDEINAKPSFSIDIRPSNWFRVEMFHRLVVEINGFCLGGSPLLISDLREQILSV